MVFVAFPDVFTPWIKGREYAIDRNWNDRQQYNANVAAQLQNMYNIETMAPRIQQAQTQAGRGMSELDLFNLGLDVAQAQQPGRMAQANIISNVATSPQGRQLMSDAEMAQLQFNLAQLGLDQEIINLYMDRARQGDLSFMQGLGMQGTQGAVAPGASPERDAGWQETPEEAQTIPTDRFGYGVMPGTRFPVPGAAYGGPIPALAPQAQQQFIGPPSPPASFNGMGGPLGIQYGDPWARGYAPMIQ